MEFNYSEQAKILIKRFGNNWNQVDFEAWLSANGYDIGSQTILTYILFKEKEEKKNGTIKQ